MVRALIYMVEDLIQKCSNHPDSGFYLNNLGELSNKIIELENEGQNIILIGVTYALLDLIEYKKFQIKKYHHHGNWWYERQKKRNSSEKNYTKHLCEWIWRDRDSFRIWHDRIIITSLFL